MRPKFRSTYDVYKTEYLQLKENDLNKIKNFSIIVEKAYDQAIILFKPFYVVLENDPYEIFKLHEFGEDKRYTANRYETTDKPMNCNDKEFIVNNPDIAYSFAYESKRIFKDTWINKLPINNSTGSTRWESYNWTLCRDKMLDDNNVRNFHMIFANMDDSFKAEIGVKHTMLGQGNDFYAGGELRIVHDVKNKNIIIVQVNLDSSSFGPGFANIFKNLCSQYVDCLKQNLLEVDLKNVCPFGSRNTANIICENFDEKYKGLLDFKIIGSVRGQPKGHFEEPAISKRFKKFQKILDAMTTIIRNTIRQIFEQMIYNPHYKLQIIGDNDWYPQGLNGYRGLHWYYYNDICPTETYINEANKWAFEHGYTQLFINKK